MNYFWRVIFWSVVFCGGLVIFFNILVFRGEVVGRELVILFDTRWRNFALCILSNIHLVILNIALDIAVCIDLDIAVCIDLNIDVWIVLDIAVWIALDIKPNTFSAIIFPF